MNTTIIQEPTAEEAVEIRAQIDAYLAKMKRLNAEMAQDRDDFNRLKLETQALRAESHSLMARTQEILAALEAA